MLPISRILGRRVCQLVFLERCRCSALLVHVVLQLLFMGRLAIEVDTSGEYELRMRDMANVRHRTLLVSRDGLEKAKGLITNYKLGKIREMTPELWQAKKIVDSTIHPGAPLEDERGIF